MWWRPAPARSASSSTPARTPPPASPRSSREHRLRPAAVLVTHGHIDHMWSVAPRRRRVRRRRLHPPGRPAPAHRPDGRACRPRPRRCSLGWRLRRSPSPTTCASSPTASTLELAGLRVRRRPHARAHPGSVTFRAPYAGPEDVPEVMFSGDLLFAGSIGRTDLPGGDHPTMLRSLADQGAAARRRHRRAARVTGRRPRSAASAPPTPTSLDLAGTVGTDEPRQEAADHMSKPTPLSGFPELLPSQRNAELAVIDSLRETFELHGFASIETRVGRAARPAAAQGRDRQGGVRPAPAAGRRRTTPTPGSGCTSTSPCRSRATCSSTPGKLEFPFRRYQIQKAGAASGRRRAATASSPRPTSTSSAATSCLRRRRRGGRGDGRGAEPAAAAAADAAGQQPQADRGLLPRARRRPTRPR